MQTSKAHTPISAINCKQDAFAFGSAKRHERHLGNRIRAAFEKGNCWETRYFVDRYLRSFDCKLVAVERAAKGMRPRRRPGKSSFLGTAEKLNAWSGTTENVQVNFEPKDSSSGDFRPVCDFGIENRALQHLVKRVLLLQSNLRPNQFAQRGVTRAMRCVESALNDGFAHVRQVDIAGCFNGFDEGKIPKLLPLPEEVTRRIIVSKDLPLVPGNCKGILEPELEKTDPELVEEVFKFSAVRQGLPQGSVVSPLVAEILLAPVIDSLPAVGRTVNYADNYLVMAETSSDADDVVKALRNALKSHPAGPLATSWIKKSGPGEPFDFLGYTVTIEGNSTKFRPTDQKLQGFIDEFRRRRKKLRLRQKKGKLSHSDVAQLAKHVANTCQVYRLWEGREKFIKQLLKKLEEFQFLVDAAG